MECYCTSQMIGMAEGAAAPKASLSVIVMTVKIVRALHRESNRPRLFFVFDVDLHFSFLVQELVLHLETLYIFS